MPEKFSRKRPAFTLIEIVVIVAIIGMMIFILVPMFVVGRKRVKAENVLNDLKVLNSAVHLYAVDTGKSSGFNPEFKDLKKYLDKKSHVYQLDGKDRCGNAYGKFIVDMPPKVPEITYEYFSGVVDDSFWSIYR